MNVLTVLVAIIVCLLILQAISIVVIYRLVTNLSEKIALPLYDKATRQVAYIRPEKKNKENTANLADAEEDTYISVDDVPEDMLYKAVLGRTDE